MSGWLVPHPARARARVELVCLPYAGGGAAVYATWPRLLPEWVAVTAVQLPGRGPSLREPPMVDAEQVADVVAHQVAAGMRGDVALYGHSMGALLAYEVARRLDAAGVVPVRLFVAALPAPQRLRRSGVVSRLPAPAFVEALRELGGTPDELLGSPELMELVLPALRADFRLCEDYRYRPGPPIRASIVAIGGNDDSSARRDDLAAWADHTACGLVLHMVPGGHFFLDTDAGCVTRLVGEELASALTSGR